MFSPISSSHRIFALFFLTLLSVFSPMFSMASEASTPGCIEAIRPLRPGEAGYSAYKYSLLAQSTAEFFDNENRERVQRAFEIALEKLGGSENRIRRLTERLSNLPERVHLVLSRKRAPLTVDDAPFVETAIKQRLLDLDRPDEDLIVREVVPVHLKRLPSLDYYDGHWELNTALGDPDRIIR